MKYNVKFLFYDERKKLCRKHFKIDTNKIFMSDIFKFAEMLNVEKIIFDKGEQNGESTSIKK